LSLRARLYLENASALIPFEGCLLSLQRRNRLAPVSGSCRFAGQANVQEKAILRLFPVPGIEQGLKDDAAASPFIAEHLAKHYSEIARAALRSCNFVEVRYLFYQLFCFFFVRPTPRASARLFREAAIPH